MRELNCKRILIKVGSSSLVKSDFSINLEVIASIVRTFSILMKKGYRVGIVSSGAVACGLHELGLKKRPKEMSLIQALAAVGQAKLMEAYNMVGNIYGVKMGQILVNHDDFQYMNRMKNLSMTLDEMMKNGIVPIINENDAISTEEIKVGDNDTLSALIAPMIKADLLILFSDIDGLYDKNPKLHDDARLIDEVEELTDEILSYAGVSSSLVGTGGMTTKLNAARIACASGIDMIICNSNQLDSMLDIVSGDVIGTWFKRNSRTISSRADYIIYKAHAKGSIVCDDGLKKVLSTKKVSILPRGIVKVNGVFIAGDVIEVIDSNNNILAKGICSISSDEMNRCKGMSTDEAKNVLGYSGKLTFIHIDNLII